MISLTKAVRDPETDELLGVAGMDLTTGLFAQLLASNPIGTTGGVLLTDFEGRPLAPFLNHDTPVVGYQIQPGLDTAPQFFTTPPGAPILKCLPGTHPLIAPNGESYVYQAAPLREPGYCIVAYQKKSEAYSSLYWTAGAMAFFAALVLFTSLFFRQLLARFVLDNIGKILENISRNSEHFSDAGADLEYIRLPPRGPWEIAGIARQLNALYKSLQKAFLEVRAERDRAELATKAKSRFLSLMSHEVRTPLNSMLGLTDVLLLSPMNPEQMGHLQVLQRSGRSLLRILNDVLDFSRLEAGKLTIESHEFDLFELLYDIESLMKVDAESKGLRFQIAAPEENYRIWGDSIRIRQALLNFVGNAIKFTDEGRVEVRVALFQGTTPDTLNFRFEVSDTGIGMTDEQQAKIFSEFSQGDAAIPRRYGGTGLGLAISRHIVELLDGKITLVSEVGKGSTFRFTIPLKVLQREKSDYGKWIAARSTCQTRVALLTHPSGAAIVPSPNAPAVLVVDDDEDNHSLIRAYLGFRPDLNSAHVATATEALAKLKERHFEIILMDMQMPEIDGLKATRTIRRLEEEGLFRRHAIIILSANTFAEDRARSLASGADEHLAKPITLDVFQALLKRWIPTV